jgi:hypothetical protein
MKGAFYKKAHTPTFCSPKGFAKCTLHSKAHVRRGSTFYKVKREQHPYIKHSIFLIPLPAVQQAP